MDPPESQNAEELGASFRQSRKEMWVMVGAWIVFFAWTIGYCSAHAFGSQDEGAPLDLILGMPKWVVYGIGLPWIFANVFIVWFSGWFMKDTPLGGDEPSEQSDQ